MSDECIADVGRGIRLCVRIDGPEDGPPLLLIAGLGLDLLSWPRELVDGFIGRGFRVVRFDNRDVGRSTHVTTPPPSKLQQFRRTRRDLDYDLGDMAADVIGLLDAIDMNTVDLVGMSMGGMIAQIVAGAVPDRVRSLTSIFSTTGARAVGQPALSAMLRMGRGAPRTVDAHVRRHIGTLRHIGSTEFPWDERIERAWAAQQWERRGGRAGAAGVDRQIAAIWKSGDRTAGLRRITAPTLVIHGDRDRMVAPTGGAATAAAVSGSRLVTIPGMRHHIGPGLAPRLVELIADHAESARPSRKERL